MAAAVVVAAVAKAPAAEGTIITLPLAAAAAAAAVCLAFPTFLPLLPLLHIGPCHHCPPPIRNSTPCPSSAPAPLTYHSSPLYC